MKVTHLLPDAKTSLAKLSLASGQTIDLYITSNVALDTRADCWLFLLLPICMKLGEDLEIDGELSSSAIDSFNEAQDWLLTGHPSMKRIELKTNGKLLADLEPEGATKVGLFYSGGLDSVYAAETIEGIEVLVTNWGFDIPTKNEKHWDLALKMSSDYAQETNRKLITIKTNIRELSNGLLEWGGDYHGTALSGVAKALSKHLSKVHVAAGFIRQSTDWGHSPELYAAYSTKFQVIEQTEPVLRIAKAFEMASNPRTESIRACYRNISGLANCGTCKKCVRTRLEFELVKAQYRPPGLEIKPSTKELLQAKLTKWDYLFYLEAINWARSKGFKRTLVPLLATSCARIATKFTHNK